MWNAFVLVLLLVLDIGIFFKDDFTQLETRNAQPEQPASGLWR
jgi:hypothetical protein